MTQYGRRFSSILCHRTDKTSLFKGSVEINKNLTIKGDLTFGDASTDTLTVTGSATFQQGLTVSTNKKIQFRDTGIYINSGADGKLTISADGTGSDDITLDGTVTVNDDLTVGNNNITGNLKTCTVTTDAKGTPTEGDLKWDSSAHKLQVYNGTSWETVSSS